MVSVFGTMTELNLRQQLAVAVVTRMSTVDVPSLALGQLLHPEYRYIRRSFVFHLNFVPVLQPMVVRVYIRMLTSALISLRWRRACYLGTHRPCVSRWYNYLIYRRISFSFPVRHESRVKLFLFLEDEKKITTCPGELLSNRQSKSCVYLKKHNHPSPELF